MIHMNMLLKFHLFQHKTNIDFQGSYRNQSIVPAYHKSLDVLPHKVPQGVGLDMESVAKQLPPIIYKL